jgi:hypothetical protein
VLVAVALLGLLAVVTLAASRGNTLRSDGGSREPSSAAYDYLFTFGLVWAAVSFVVLLYVLRPSGRFKHDRKEHGIGWSLVALALALAFLIGVLLAGRGEERASRPEPVGAPAGTATSDQREAEPTAGRQLEFQWRAVLAVGGAALLGAGAVVLLRRRRSATDEGRDAELADELAALIDDTLDDLRNEPDPRRAVVAAYARMERAFAAYGVARRPFEAPYEYLRRIPDAVPAWRRLAFDLTELYERAKFSEHEIDAGMKAEAISTLEALRMELRAVEDAA